MINITQAVVDIADCNVTFGALDRNPPPPLDFTSEDEYLSLYSIVAAEQPYYQKVSGQEGTILYRLAPVYSENKYWRRYLASRDVVDYWTQAWDCFLPIAATILDMVDVVLPDKYAVKVSPKPFVLLYPFGWANWLSLRITGNFGLEDLAALVQHLITAPAYQVDEPGEKIMDLGALFAYVSKGVRKDAYDPKSAVRNPQSFLTVTTVLAKHGGSPALHALSEGEALALKELVRPGAPQAQANVAAMASRLPFGTSDDLDYVLHDGTSWFIWADHKLWPEGRNQQHLRCYHNNTFRSLLQASMLENLLKHAAATKPWSAVVTEVVGNAVTAIESSPALGEYKNLSLRSYLERPELLKTVQDVKKRLAPKEGHA